MKDVRAFVFDLDGTLVDSKIDFDGMKAELQLRPEDDVLEKINALAPARRETALRIVYRYEQAGAEAAMKIEGALEFCEAIRAASKPIAIFTRNARSLAETCLKDHGFQVDMIVAREDADPKPKPNGLFKIAKEFDVKPSELLFVGDYIYDLQAGLAAGTKNALYIPEQADFDTTGADLIFSTYRYLTDFIFPRV